MRDERPLTTPYSQDDDLEKHWEAVRPRFLAEYIGQAKIREQLEVFLEAVKMRNESMDHILLYGPPGLGKTTLAHIIANELGVRLETTSGPALEHPGDIAAILTNLEHRDALFIDEIHRLNRIVEEKLYPAMEDFKLDLVMGQGPAARIIPLDIEPFTLIGATTRFGALSSPLRNRFGIVFRLEFYSESELLQVIQRSARILKIQIDESGAHEIAKRSRGTPRIANRMLRRVRDFAQVRGDGVISVELADRSLDIMEIDKKGLDPMDRKLMSLIINNFSGGPVGIDTLATALMEDRETIEDVYEPFLIQCGLIRRTSRGRIVTKQAYDHLNLSHLYKPVSPEIPFDEN